MRAVSRRSLGSGKIWRKEGAISTMEGHSATGRGSSGRSVPRRVVITGLGCVTPFGAGVERFWENLTAGRSGIRPLQAFDASVYGTRIAGEVPEFRPRDFMPQRDVSSTARVTQLGIAATRIALDEARLPLEGRDTSRVGVFYGTSVGTFAYAAENHAVFLEKGIRRVHPLFPAQSYSGVVATQLAITFGVRGMAIAVSTACSSATDAIGTAWLHIRSGLLDCAIVGGTEAPITPLLFAAFDRLGIMSRQNEEPARASRPFAAARDGFVMSEAAATLILESEEHAASRGGTPLAELAGYGATSDGFHPFSPLPTGEEGVRALRMALDSAEVMPDEVDHVNAHAIGSRTNDPIELDILRQVLGERATRVPVTANKSMVGHTMGAAGALELLASIQTLRTQTIPPTVNLESLDRECGFDLVPDEARPAEVRVVLSPTFGFGSRNAALVVRRGCMESVVERALSILARELNLTINDVAPTHRLREDLGMDSIIALNVMFAAERELGVSLREEDVVQLDTVSDLLSLLSKLNP
jgi:3-oxoacyl-[acyl-carrier-protein] synthase II